MKALIIGGGIAGLATARALERVGIEPLVFERAPALVEVGAGLSLWSNAIKALRCLGLDQDVLARGSVLERARTITPAGRLLDELAIGELSRRCGAPSICLSRADLQDCLSRAIPPDRLHTGTDCVGFDDDGQGVSARFADGRIVHGDLLISADGIHSTIRRQLHGPAEPRYSGYVAWRGIAEMSHPEIPTDGSVLAVGPGSQVGLFPCGPGRIYWFATRNEPRGGPEPAPGSRKAEVFQALRGYWPPILEVIAATPAPAVLRNPVMDRPPSRTWGRGRVTFVGDAIHPTTPNLGQGACQAIEDAEALAVALKPPGGLERLRDYERKRRNRTAMVVRRSRSLGKILQWENPALVWLRRSLLGTGLAHRQGLRLFNDLLGFNPEDA